MEYPVIHSDPVHNDAVFHAKDLNVLERKTRVERRMLAILRWYHDVGDVLL